MGIRLIFSQDSEVEEYERATRYNYSSSEKFALVEVGAEKNMNIDFFTFTFTFILRWVRNRI